jgi:predicted outer membrane repeat protein
MTKTKLILVVAVACGGLAAALGAARAATIVTGVNCSLVDAITSANTNAAVGGCTAGSAGRDTIVTAGAMLTTPNNGDNGLPVITEDLRITSPNPAVRSFITRDFAGGTPEFRLFEIGTTNDAPRVTIAHIYMQNGQVSGKIVYGQPANGAGGCIKLRNGSLTLVDSVVEECKALGFDDATGLSAGAWGGAIAATAGSLIIRDSSFGFNTATGGAALAGGYPGAMADGGAIFATGLDELVIQGTSISSNFATGGAGVTRGGNGRGGGLTVFGTEVWIIDSSFSANAASGGAASSGTGGMGLGGAIFTEAGTALTLRDSELIGNVVNGPDSPGGTGGYAYGGGLYARGVTLTLDRSDVTDNRANGGAGASSSSNGLARGGGLYLFDAATTADRLRIETNVITGAGAKGGGIALFQEGDASAPLLLTRSTLAANSASATHDSAYGGAFYQEGDRVTIRNTTLSENSADLGGGLFQESGTAVIRLSSFSSNTADRFGGAIAVDGALTLSNTVDLANVTISGNAAGVDGGGIYVIGRPNAPDVTTVLLHNTTVTANTNSGIQLVHDRSDPVLEMGNNIIGAQASGADCAVDGSASLTSNGGNLESGTSCGLTAASDQQSVVDLGLSAIGSYGGQTLTHDLLPGSPAIDAGLRRACNREANGKDQRGLARFYDGDGDRDFACDSGAVEVQGLLANPGFEEPLDPASDWALVASGGGDGRAAVATPNGQFAAVLHANGALETLSQSLTAAGGAGETYALTLLAQGVGLTPGEAMDVTLRSSAGGAAVDTATCSFPFPSADFKDTPAPCELTTTGSYDAIETILGWTGATTGTLTLDAVSLIKR